MVIKGTALNFGKLIVWGRKANKQILQYSGYSVIDLNYIISIFKSLPLPNTESAGYK